MRLARQPLTAVAIVLIIALGIPLAADTPSQAATTLSFAPLRPMSGEYTWVRGRLATRVVRPVVLQYYKPGSGWTLYPLRLQGDGARARTFSGGYFRFRPRAIAPSRSWRVVAPRRTINGVTYRALISTPRKMYAVGQVARILRFVPAPIGQSRTGAATNLTPVNVSFSPIRRGRAILLQNYKGGSWKTIATGVQDSRGAATLNISTQLARNYSNRVVAARFNGARPWASRPGRGGARSPWFFDHFPGSSLNKDKWGIRLPGNRNASGRQCSESSGKSVSVSNGTLKLQTKRISATDLDPMRKKGYRPNLEGACEHGQFYNGHIGTRKKWRGAFTHGFMAARIRLQPQRGHHGGFWSQPVNPDAASGSEIDAIEYYGNFSSRIQHTIYRDGTVMAKSYQRRNYLLPPNVRWSDRWHVFSVEWTPKVYIFRIDGHETFRTARGVSQTPQYLITSLLSSDWEVEHLPKSGSIAPMHVDWVRSWR